MTRTTLVLLATLHAASALQALVLGGGFAGLYTAPNLANGGVKTTLVDERERFAFLPLLYDYACGAADADEVSAPFEELCRVPNLTFKRASVESIDFDAKSATLDDGTRLEGEALVVANCLVALFLLVTSLRSIGVLGVELRELQLTFVDDKSVVQLPVFNDEFATHL